MKNWDVFIIVSTFVIVLSLFSSGRVSADNLTDHLHPLETIIVISKTLLMVLMACIGILSMMFVLVSDIVVSILFRLEFPIIHFLYEYAYLGVMKGWYWDAHSGSHLFMASVTLFGIGVINTYLGSYQREKTVVYHKSAQADYTSH